MSEKNYPEMTWNKLIDSLFELGEITEMSYEQWFKPAKALSMDSKALIVEVEDDYSKNWIHDTYQKLLDEHLHKLLGQPLKVFITTKQTIEPQDSLFSPQIDNLSQPQQATFQPQQATFQPQQATFQPQQNVFEQLQERQQVTTHSVAPQQTVPQTNAQIGGSTPRAANLNETLTFDNFVSGSSNLYAYNVAKAISENPGTQYNPMFLYGGSGLGKTHLVQAIGNEILAKHPGKIVKYITSEAFLSEYVSSIHNKNSNTFRESYRQVDVLIIDDIQFFVGKEGVQEEFFHTFNHLHQLDKQIIITSDSQPNELATLTDRLRTRFSWGILTDIQAPELETRMAILYKKIASLSSLTGPGQVPDEVIQYIASNVDSNVRELEGALNGVMAQAAMLGQIDITLELAVEALKSYTQKESQKISIARIQKIVASYYHTDINELKSKSRKEPLTTYRHIAIYLCKQLTPNSLQNIGKQFGNRDHTTIMNSIRKIETLLKKDPDLQAVIEELEKQITIG